MGVCLLGMMCVGRATTTFDPTLDERRVGSKQFCLRTRIYGQRALLKLLELSLTGFTGTTTLY
jgi:hypothetical protein